MMAGGSAGVGGVTGKGVSAPQFSYIEMCVCVLKSQLYIGLLIS